MPPIRSKCLQLVLSVLVALPLGVRGEIQDEADDRMAWWLDARFGVFIHWGPDAIPSLHWNGKPWNTGPKTLPDGQTRLYLHVFEQPADGRLILPQLNNEIRQAYRLADAEQNPLTVVRKDSTVVVSLPAEPGDQSADVVVLHLDGKPGIQPQ